MAFSSRMAAENVVQQGNGSEIPDMIEIKKPSIGGYQRKRNPRGIRLIFPLFLQIGPTDNVIKRK